jgi:hypothetical protein
VLCQQGLTSWLSACRACCACCGAGLALVAVQDGKESLSLLTKPNARLLAASVGAQVDGDAWLFGKTSTARYCWEVWEVAPVSTRAKYGLTDK